MSSYISERIALAAVIDPDTVGSGSHTSDAVDMSRFERVLFIFAVGVMPGSGTATFKLQESDASGGAYSDVTGKTVSLTKAASDDDKQAMIEIKADELSDGKRYVRGHLTVNDDTPAAVLALASDARYKPASDQNLPSVKQIVR